jgi:hypothetical protein
VSQGFPSVWEAEHEPGGRADDARWASPRNSSTCRSPTPGPVRSPTRRTSVSKSRLAMSLRPDRQLEAGPPGGPRAATGGFATRPTQALRDRADICRQGGDVGPGLQARDEAANVVMDCTQAIDDPRVNVVLGERRMRWGASNRSTSTPTTRQQSASSVARLSFVDGWRGAGSRRRFWSR